MRKIITFAVLLFVAGCTTHTTDGHKLTHREMQCLNRVNVLMIDTTPRSPSTKVDIIIDESSLIAKANKPIAFLTCEGAAKEEIDMTKGIAEKARLLGADAIVILNANLGSDFQMGHGGSRAVFRAKAIVYQ